MPELTTDEAALEEAVRSLAPRLLRYCLAVTRRAETAEEVAQEALAALVDRWRRHGAPDVPEAFVFAVARRRPHAPVGMPGLRRTSGAPSMTVRGGDDR